MIGKMASAVISTNWDLLRATHSPCNDSETVMQINVPAFFVGGNTAKTYRNMKDELKFNAFLAFTALALALSLMGFTIKHQI
jgi:hypothetical protein